MPQNGARDGNDDDAVTARGMLFAGAWRGEDATVRRLVSSGAAPINARDENGVTAIRFTAQYGHKELTDFLLDNGADPNIKAREASFQIIKSSIYFCFFTVYFRGFLAFMRILDPSSDKD